MSSLVNLLWQELAATALRKTSVAVILAFSLTLKMLLRSGGNPKLIVVSNVGNHQQQSNIDSIRYLVEAILGPDVEVRWTGEDGTITILSARLKHIHIVG